MPKTVTNVRESQEERAKQQHAATGSGEQASAI